MSKFKGYAQSSGFKNIQLPDTTRRIREEGERTISRMEQTFKIEQENAEAVLNALQDKYRVEAGNRQVVFDLESENRNQIRNQMIANANVARANNQQEQKATQQTFAALAEFSNTAASVSKQILTDLDERGKQKGANLANTLAASGLSYADMEYVRSLEKAHLENDERFNTIIEKLIVGGASNDVIQQVRNANSSTFYGLKKTMLVNAGIDYGNYSLENETAPLLAPDGSDTGFTLGQARSMGLEYKELVDAQDLQNKADYLEQLGGAEDPMVARYTLPKILELETANARGRAAENLKNIQREAKLARLDSWVTTYNDGGIQGGWQRVQQAPNRGQARKEWLESLTNMALVGELGDSRTAMDVFNEISNMMVSIDGGKTTRRFAEQFNSPELVQLRNAIVSFRDFNESEKNKIDKQNKDRALADAYAYVVKNNYRFNDDFVKDFISKLEKEGIDTAPLKSLFDQSTDEPRRKQFRAFLLNEKRRGNLDLSDFDGIDDPFILKEFETDIKRLTDDEANLKQTLPDVEKIFQTELADKVDILDPNGYKSLSFYRAVDYAVSLYRQQMADDQGGGLLVDRNAQQERAINTIVLKIRDKEDPDFAVKPYAGVGESPPGVRSFFTRFEPGYGNKQYIAPEVGVIPSKLRELLKQDPGVIDRQAFISTSLANNLATQIEKNTLKVIPPIYHELARGLDRPAHEILQKQIELATGKQVLVAPDLHSQVKSSVTDPKLLAIIESPGREKLRTAIIASNNSVPSIRRGTAGWPDVVSVTRNVGFRFPRLAAAIWAQETGYGQSMSGKNVLFNIKSTDGTGSSTTTKEFINGQYVDRQATWQEHDTPRQAALAFKEYVDKYPGFKEARTPLEALQALHAGGYATDPDYVFHVSNLMKEWGVDINAPALAYSGPPERDPNFSSPTLQHIYNVDSLGWGSTGPHLDLKQMDNPYTPDNERGQYFNYRDPEIMEHLLVQDSDYGDSPVPVSDTAISDGWQEHVNRGSNGYDFKLQYGAKILIKPPARVVRTAPGDEGSDILWIELPSGRTLQLIHGRAVQ